MPDPAAPRSSRRRGLTIAAAALGLAGAALVVPALTATLPAPTPRPAPPTAVRASAIDPLAPTTLRFDAVPVDGHRGADLEVTYSPRIDDPSRPPVGTLTVDALAAGRRSRLDVVELGDLPDVAPGQAARFRALPPDAALAVVPRDARHVAIEEAGPGPGPDAVPGPDVRRLGDSGLAVAVARVSGRTDLARVGGFRWLTPRGSVVSTSGADYASVALPAGSRRHAWVSRDLDRFGVVGSDTSITSPLHDARTGAPLSVTSSGRPDGSTQVEAVGLLPAPARDVEVSWGPRLRADDPPVTVTLPGTRLVLYVARASGTDPGGTRARDVTVAWTDSGGRRRAARSTA